MMPTVNGNRFDRVLRRIGAGAKRTRSRWASLVLLALAASTLGGVACSRGEDAAPLGSSMEASLARPAEPTAPPAAQVADRTLPGETKALAQDWLLELKQAHTAASAARTDAEKRAALLDLGRAFEHATELSRKLTATPAVEAKGVTKGAPGQMAHAEVVSLSQDLASRAARIELALGSGAAALAWAERGLALSPAPSVLRANLLLDAADAHGLSGRPALGKPFLLEALRINQRLLDEELETP